MLDQRTRFCEFFFNEKEVSLKSKFRLVKAYYRLVEVPSVNKGKKPTIKVTSGTKECLLKFSMRMIIYRVFW